MKAASSRAPVESSVGAEIRAERFPEIVRTIVGVRLICLLGVVTVFREITIQISGEEFVGDDRRQRGKADNHFATFVVCGPVNAASGHFRLKDRRHRLRRARQTAFDPFEMRRIQRGQLHHREMNVDPVVQQFRSN